MERLMEDQEVNFAYWCHSQWRDARFWTWSSKITSFKLENKKNNRGEGKLDSTFKKTCYLTILKGMWQRR
jgi:hypothetical protein